MDTLLIAPNLLKQEFVAAATNRVWLADITYIRTGEGWLYLAAVLNLATRKIVGWRMRDHMRTELPLAALMTPRSGKDGRKPESGDHSQSDRGWREAKSAWLRGHATDDTGETKTATPKDRRHRVLRGPATPDACRAPSCG